MDRRTIQERRKKRYFVEAAKKVICEEGIENLTVKKVADLAGFAPGTLYNYFTDLNDLFFYCAEDFWLECRDYVIKNLDKSSVKQEIISSSKAYCEYFIENPNVFELIFLKDFDELPAEPPEVVLLLIETLARGVEEGLIPGDRVEMVENLISTAIHGVLLFIIKRRTTSSKEEVLDLIQDEIEYILDRY